MTQSNDDLEEIVCAELARPLDGGDASPGAADEALSTRGLPLAGGPAAALVRAAMSAPYPEATPGGRVQVLRAFRWNDASPTPDHAPIVDRVAQQLVASFETPQPLRAIFVSGHTDNTGTDQYNLALGERRAQAVRSALIERIEALRPGLSPQVHVATLSAGARRPIAPNNTPAARARNRRVVVVHRPPGPTPTSTTAAIRVVNRLRPSENVNACVVRLVGAPGSPTGTTGPNGRTSLPLGGVPNRTFRLVLTPALHTTDPVGPAIAAKTPRPDRIWRRLEASVTVTGGRITASTHPQITVSGGVVTARLQPVWMASPNRGARPAGTVADLCVVHHTGGSVTSSLNTFMAPHSTSAHYIIDTDGQVVKMVHESEQSDHAGVSYWDRRDGVNAFSIGIETVNTTGPYPAAQRAALIGLLNLIRCAHPGIPARRIVAHSDIGTCPAPVQCPTTTPRQLGRKSGDPGRAFDWSELEEHGLGLRLLRLPLPTIYGRFFVRFPGSTLRAGDGDAGKRYGGVARPTITPAIVAELQADLRAIGYFCPSTGVFDVPTAKAVVIFQEHFFGGRRAGTAFTPGQLDATTAAFVKAVVP